MTKIDKLFSISRACEELGITEYNLKHHFYNKSNRKEPTPTYIGNRLYFTEGNLQKFIENNTHKDA
jgi:hypothetical protein